MVMVSAEEGRTMTVAEARQRYSFATDPIGYHYQPTCVCGDYICHHEEAPPHRCCFTRNGSNPVSGCSCYRYRFGRMGSGPPPVDFERWLAMGYPPRPGTGAENGEVTDGSA